MTRGFRSRFRRSKLPLSQSIVRKVVAAAGGGGGSFGDPTDIADLALWYDFSDVSTLFQNAARSTAITADGQSIKGVTDLSGNAHHLSTTSGNLTYETNEINGLSVYKNFIDSFTIASPPTHAAAFTWFAVVKPTHNDAGSIWGDDLANSPTWRKSLYSSPTVGGEMILEREVNAMTSQSSTGHVITASPNLIGLRYDNGAIDHYHEGALTHEQTVAHTNFAAGPTYLGGGDGQSTFYSHIGEVIIYGRALTDAEIQDVEDYLGSKWGITVT